MLLAARLIKQAAEKSIPESRGLNPPDEKKPLIATRKRCATQKLRHRHRKPGLLPPTNFRHSKTHSSSNACAWS
jgi:hypothetical protein